jgi:hypothetical protein
MSNKLEDRKNSLTEIYNQKIKELQQLEQYRVKLTNELLEMKGKLELLDEMAREEKIEKEKKK